MTPPRAALSGPARPASAPGPTLTGEDDVPAALPNSLEGTLPDGAVTADADGHLVITLELRRLFDYYLAATGEEPLATIRARIIATLRKRLPPTAAGEAIAILERYLAYRETVRGFSPAPDVTTQLDRLHDLRLTMFGPEVAKAFFADEEAAQRIALARRDVQLDKSLPQDERERRLAEIAAREPESVRAARAAATAPVDELRREQQMRAAGASDQDITALRTATFGAEAAARLADLDRERATWQARLDKFRAQRAALLGDARLDGAERQRQIDELLASSFTPPERLRVEALDRIAAQAGGR